MYVCVCVRVCVFVYHEALSSFCLRRRHRIDVFLDCFIFLFLSYDRYGCNT